MKLIIAGSRDIDKKLAFAIREEIYNGEHPTIKIDKVDEYVTGCCPTGPDQVPYMQREMGRGIPIKEFRADWEKHGRAAGPIRNREMAKYADALLLIWDRKSKGSQNMKDNMQLLGKPIYEVWFPFR